MTLKTEDLLSEISTEILASLSTANNLTPRRFENFVCREQPRASMTPYYIHARINSALLACACAASS